MTYVEAADVKSPHMSVLGWAAGTGDPKSRRGTGWKEGGLKIKTFSFKRGTFGIHSNKREESHRRWSVQLGLSAVPQEGGWDPQPLHQVEVEVDPRSRAELWHHLRLSSWCSVTEKQRSLNPCNSLDPGAIEMFVISKNLHRLSRQCWSWWSAPLWSWGPVSVPGTRMLVLQAHPLVSPTYRNRFTHNY